MDGWIDGGMYLSIYLSNIYLPLMSLSIHLSIHPSLRPHIDEKYTNAGSYAVSSCPFVETDSPGNE